MAEEFLQTGGICGGTWWNLPASKGIFAGCSSPCTAAVADFGWPTEVAREDDYSSNSSSFGTFQSKLQRPDSDPTLQIMNFGLSSWSASDWNQSFPSRNNSLLQDQEISESTGQLDSSVTVFKPINQDFPFDQQPVTTSSASYNYPPVTATTAAMIQTLFDDEPRPPPQQPPLFSSRPINYAAENYGRTTASSNGQLSPSWNKLPPFFKPQSLIKQQQSLQFTNDAPFWNAASNDVGGDRFSASSPPQFLRTVFGEKATCPNQLPTKRNGEEARDGNTKKVSNESPPVKKARVETPSPLPTFKVRKEKLGDRITALQQLVSPFGKTDTASVLHEAIDYIKFLHDQVLSTPYMKQGPSPNQHQQMKGIIPADSNKPPKDTEVAGANEDLRSRGLCLVPISSTFPVASETTADFWTPTFGATFR